ncbi:MAG: cation transporter [Chloroflexi bacterium]|nr:cation transporter [Chloroflexota bacterium]
MSIPRIALALVLTLAFVFVEAGAGLFANSLALLTDAAHNLTDVVALALSWYAIRLAIRPAHAGKTFGYHRVGILVALANSTTLVLISAGIFYEAYQRLLAPPVVAENVLIGVGALAFVVNLATAWMVSHGSESDLNLRSTYLHLMGDVLSTLGAVLAGIAIKFTGWQILDPLVSVLIGALILWNAWKILRETVDILLEGTPRDLDMYDLVSALEQVAGVHNVHDLHVWSINQSMRALSAHVLIDDMAISQGARIRQELNELLTHTYRIDHATLQFECAGCDPAVLYCNLAVPVGHEHEH